MNFDLVTKIIVDMTVATTDTVDTAGAESCVFSLETINTTAVTLEEGDEVGGGDSAAVPEQFILVGDKKGTLADNVVTYAEATTAFIGYVGKKRYVTITVANPATNTAIAKILGNLHDNPGVSA